MQKRVVNTKLDQNSYSDWKYLVGAEYTPAKVFKLMESLGSENHKINNPNKEEYNSKSPPKNNRNAYENLDASKNNGVLNGHKKMKQYSGNDENDGNVGYIENSNESYDLSTSPNRLMIRNSTGRNSQISVSRKRRKIRRKNILLQNTNSSGPKNFDPDQEYDETIQEEYGSSSDFIYKSSFPKLNNYQTESNISEGNQLQEYNEDELEHSQNSLISVNINRIQNKEIHEVINLSNGNIPLYIHEDMHEDIEVQLQVDVSYNVASPTNNLSPPIPTTEENILNVSSSFLPLLKRKQAESPIFLTPSEPKFPTNFPSDSRSLSKTTHPLNEHSERDSDKKKKRHNKKNQHNEEERASNSLLPSIPPKKKLIPLTHEKPSDSYYHIVNSIYGNLVDNISQSNFGSNHDIAPVLETLRKKKRQIQSQNYTSFKNAVAKGFTPYRYYTNFKTAIQFADEIGILKEKLSN